MNTKNTGSISAGYTWDEDNKKADTDPKWTATIATGDFSAYGSFYSTPILLATKDAVKNLLGSTLMIIPQTNTAWDKTAGDTEGTYILLLCRVELEHPGTAHTGTGSDADDTTLDDVKIQNGKHYHQQFPVNANSKFEAGEYGLYAFLYLQTGKWVKDMYILSIYAVPLPVLAPTHLICLINLRNLFPQTTNTLLSLAKKLL